MAVFGVQGFDSLALTAQLGIYRFHLLLVVLDVFEIGG